MSLYNRSFVAAYFGALVSLTGCATSVQAPPREVFSTTQVRHLPELATIAKAELGDSMVSTENVSRISGISVNESYAEAVNPPGTTSVSRGDYALFLSRPEGNYYQGNASYSMLGSSIDANDRAGIFVPTDKTKPAVIYHYALGYRYGTKPITYSSKEIVRTTSESFRRELMYSGVSQNTVTLVYREFKDNLARPAFSQELKYDISKDRVIGYKGARFEVIDAGNTQITYKVLSVLQ